MSISRRDLIRRASLIAGGFTGLPAWTALGRHLPRPICGVADVAPGAAFTFSFPGEDDSCVLVRTADGKFHAFSRTCTHLGCLVDWDPKAKRLQCPCHGGAYDVATGDVLEGPPPEALPRVVIQVRDGRVWALWVRA